MSAGSGPAGHPGPGWSPENVAWDAQEVRTASAAGAEKRKRRRFTHGGCQVEGCSAPTELAYHKKYHICGDHFKAPCVAIDGQNLRFCQKCGRFQPLSEFQGVKRTCQKALDSHNARRRKREEAKHTASPSAGEGGSPPAQQCQQREERQHGERRQRSGSGGSTGSASGQGGSAREAGGSSARAPSGTTGRASLSPETEPGAAAAARDVQQGAPSSGAAATFPVATAARATPSAPSSLSQPQLLAAAPHVQPMQQQQQPVQQTLAAWPQVAAHQAQVGWQQQSMGTYDHEPSRLQGQREDSSMLAQHGSGSFQSGGGQTNPSSGMHPTGSGQTHPGSSPYAALLPLGVPQHGSGFYPASAGPPAHSNGFAHAGGAQQLPAGWPAVTAAPTLQPYASGQLVTSLPMLHMAAHGAATMPSLAAPAVVVPQQGPCLVGVGCAPMPAGYAAVPAPLDGMMGMGLPELKTEGLPPMSPLLGCLLDGPDVGKWQPHSVAASGSFGGSPPGQPQLGCAPAAHSSPAAAVLTAAGMPMHMAATVAAVAGDEYISPARLHRMSLKIFGCSPDQLGPGIRAELEAVLRESAGLIEASIRPGCTHVTANLHMGHGGGSVPFAIPAAEMLERLLSPAALGAAAGNSLLLQWRGQLAGTSGGGAPVGTMALPEPRLQVRPACVLAPPAGQPWPLVQLQLRAGGSAGSSGGPGSLLEGGLAACMQQSTVLCRQAGRHLPVEVWGTTAAAAAAALSWAPVLRDVRSDRSAAGSGSEAGGSGGGSDSEPTSTTSSRSVLLRDASIKSSDSEEEAADPAALPELAPAVAAAAAGSAEASPPAALRLWVRPVGLRPGCCEMEMQVQLPCGLPGAAPGEGPRAVLLSRPAPLLVMRDVAAAREVQAMVRASGRTGAECFDDLLRDVGTAVAFLEQQQQPADDVDSPIPPGFAAAAAHAAAECAHRRGMHALAALLQRALAAARAAVAAAAADSLPAGEAPEEAGCSKAKQLAAEEEVPLKPQQQPVVASKAGKPVGDSEGRALGLLGPCARFGTRSSAAVKAEAMLAERVGSGRQPTSLPCDTLLRLCALLAAIFAGVMAHRLVLQGADA